MPALDVQADDSDSLIHAEAARALGSLTLRSEKCQRSASKSSSTRPGLQNQVLRSEYRLES